MRRHVARCCVLGFTVALILSVAGVRPQAALALGGDEIDAVLEAPEQLCWSFGGTRSSPCSGIADTWSLSVVITNSGSVATHDNVGDEFSLLLPPTFVLSGATATSGIASADTSSNLVTWNGDVPGGGSVTITFSFGLNPNPGVDRPDSYHLQGVVNYQSGDEAINDSSILSDDPDLDGSQDATRFNMVLLFVDDRDPLPTAGADTHRTSLLAAAMLWLGGALAFGSRRRSAH